MESLITAFIAAGAAIIVARISHRASPKPEIARAKDLLAILNGLPEDSIMHSYLRDEVDLLIERILAKSINIPMRIAFFSGTTLLALMGAMIYEDSTSSSLLPMDRHVWEWALGILFGLFVIFSFLGMRKIKSNLDARVEQYKKKRSLRDQRIRDLLDHMRADASPTDPPATNSEEAPDG